MYRLTITEHGSEAIAFLGNRYGWSDALSHYEVGTHRLPESDAWEIQDACHADTEGGHGRFPGLDPQSEQHELLSRFLDSIV
jgi:hypothetical protein